MIKIEFMKPFFAKFSGKQLRLVFAYQYLSISKDDEVFHFIPIEGQEMKIDTFTRQVKNLSEVFVFQRGNRFIRLPLYQLLLVSNISDYLDPIIESNIPKGSLVLESSVDNEEVNEIVFQLEKQQLLRAIDATLDKRDENAFNKLVEKIRALDAVGVPKQLEVC